MKRFVITEEEKKHIMGLYEQTTTDTLTLENIGQQFNELVFSGMEYRGSVGGERLSGVIVLTSEFSEMNKRNNWNRPERIDINFSSAKKMIITPDLENLAKEKKIVLGNPLKSDYSKITFTSISQEAGLFGEIPSGKIQSNSILIRCTQGADTLFIYKSPDNNWNYVNITYS
jgi:hypothetical protein